MEVTYYSDSENYGVGAYIIGNLWFECFGVLAISITVTKTLVMLNPTFKDLIGRI